MSKNGHFSPPHQESYILSNSTSFGGHHLNFNLYEAVGEKEYEVVGKGGEKLVRRKSSFQATFISHVQILWVEYEVKMLFLLQGRTYEVGG